MERDGAAGHGPHLGPCDPPAGAEPAFSQPEPEPHGPAAGPDQGHASTIQQERADQRRRGNLATCVGASRCPDYYWMHHVFHAR